MANRHRRRASTTNVCFELIIISAEVLDVCTPEVVSLRVCDFKILISSVSKYFIIFALYR